MDTRGGLAECSAAFELHRPWANLRTDVGPIGCVELARYPPKDIPGLILASGVPCIVLGPFLCAASSPANRGKSHLPVCLAQQAVKSSMQFVQNPYAFLIRRATHVHGLGMVFMERLSGCLCYWTFGNALGDCRLRLRAESNLPPKAAVPAINPSIQPAG
jgi:hypothetical protein